MPHTQHVCSTVEYSYRYVINTFSWVQLIISEFAHITVFALSHRSVVYQRLRCGKIFIFRNTMLM